MESYDLPKPVRISPIIKIARWSLLLSGIAYGRSKFRYYHKIQTERRENYARNLPNLIKKRKAEELERATEEYKKIAVELGIELPKDWTAEVLIK